jgi:shikimate dehydrogenase
MTFSAIDPRRPTDRYAVLGHPVAHSRSPTIHAAFARACGEQLHYGRLLCPLDGFEAALRAWVASESEPVEGGGGELMVAGPVRGCNVTVPFKFDAYRLAARHSARAALAEAANVLSFEPGGWRADNTDGAGLVRDIQHNAGTELAGRQVLVIGAGGAAAGALGPLLEARPALLVLANRTAAKAVQLVHRHTALASVCGVELRATGLDDTGGGYDVVVNASASSLHTASVPVPGSALRPGALALDMMYGPAAAPFLAWAAEHGANGRDGLGMLVEQAAESFAVWRGVRPATAEVLAALRAGANQVLR